MLGAAPVAGSGFAFDGAPAKPDAALPGITQPAAQAATAQALKKAAAASATATAPTETSLNSLQYAAEGGHPVAQWKLGRMYANGDGVIQDDLRAFEYFSRIANAACRGQPVGAAGYDRRQRLRGAGTLLPERHSQFQDQG